MQTIFLKAVFMSLLVLSFNCTECIAENMKINPHSDEGDCAVCHVAPASKLRSWFAFASTKRELKYGLNQICQQCHTIEPTPAGSLGIGIGHATGKKTAVNNQNLPLAGDGTITCATTCHDMHITSDDKQQQLKHLRLPVNSLCVSCHDK